MTRDEDLIRDSLWPESEGLGGAQFSAAVLFRLGQRRRMVRIASRFVTLAGATGAFAALAPQFARALAPLQTSIDLPALAAGLLLLLSCAMLVPARS